MTQGNAFKGNFELKDMKAAPSLKLDWTVPGLVLGVTQEKRMRFVHTTFGCVVLKPSSTIAADVFADKLASLLGVRTSTSRLLIRGSKSTGTEFSDANFAVSRQQCVQAGMGAHLLNNKEAEERFRRGPDSFPFVLLLDFIPGPTLGAVEQNKLLSSDGLVALQDLGRILVLDIVLNNWDRLPLPNLWTHEGNPDNFILSSRGLVAIDNSTTAFTNESKADSYVTSVKQLVAGVKGAQEEKDGEEAAVDEVSEYVRNYFASCGQDITQKGAKAVRSGMLQGMAAAAKITDAMVDDTYREVLEIFTPALDRLKMADDAVGLDRINPGFIKHLLHAVFRSLE